MCSGSAIPCGCGCSSPAPAKSLGLVANGKRRIRSGREYDSYFPSIRGIETQVAEGNQKRSLEEMEKVVKRTLSQTAKIAPKLKGSSLIITLTKIYDFIYNHIQYTLDEEGKEQLREPAVSWHDRDHGVDCDCYSILISSILHNLGIPHAFRMTKYKGDWQHVYIVVPKDGSKASLERRNQYFVVDPVVDHFNWEVPYRQKHDRFMSKMPITVLSGFGATDSTCIKPRPVEYIPVKQLEFEGKVATEKLLQEASVPYTTTVMKDGTTAVLVKDTALPTVLTKTQAATVKGEIIGDVSLPLPDELNPGSTPIPKQNPGLEDQGMAQNEIQTLSPEVTSDQAEPTKAGMGDGWLLALAVVGVGVAIMANNKPGKGLAGVPKKPVARKKAPAKAKRKPAKRKPAPRKKKPVSISI